MKRRGEASQRGEGCALACRMGLGWDGVGQEVALAVALKRERLGRLLRFTGSESPSNQPSTPHDHPNDNQTSETKALIAAESDWPVCVQQLVFVFEPTSSTSGGWRWASLPHHHPQFDLPTCPTHIVQDLAASSLYQPSEPLFVYATSVSCQPTFLIADLVEINAFHVFGCCTSTIIIIIITPRYK